MASLGLMNRLPVLKLREIGAFLDGGELGEILLPHQQLPPRCNVGDELEVFLYHDTETRLIATTFRPHAVVGEVGYLRVVTVNDIGAFLEWGIPKNLFVPFGEQKYKMNQGQSYSVCVYIDPTSGRITGSSKLQKFFDRQRLELEIGREVEAMVFGRTDLGFRAVVEHGAWGFLYHNEVFQDLQPGQRIKAFVKSVREDGKCDLILQKPGYEKIPDLADVILQALEDHDGFLPLNDNSSAEAISQRFGISKKTFKKAIGALFRERRIIIETNGIRLA